MVAITAADEKPGGVRQQRGGQASQKGKGKTEFVRGGESSGGQQNRRSRQGNPQLLHQNPGKEQQIPVEEQNVFR